jgi:hypothetical protein
MRHWRTTEKGDLGVLAVAYKLLELGYRPVLGGRTAALLGGFGVDTRRWQEGPTSSFVWHRYGRRDVLSATQFEI